jgi:hypothetical protein
MKMLLEMMFDRFLMAPDGADQSAGGADNADNDNNAATPPADAATPAAEGNDDGGKNNEAEPEITPETYDGLDLAGYEPAKETLAAFKSIAAKNKLTKEAAQEIISLQTALLKKQDQAYETVKEGWRAELKEKYGTNLESVSSKVVQVLDKLDNTGKAKDFMISAGILENPALVSLFEKISKDYLEQPTITGNAAATPKKQSPGETMYGDNK